PCVWRRPGGESMCRWLSPEDHASRFTLMWAGIVGAPFTLREKHAAIFRAAAAYLSEGLGWDESDSDWEAGIEVFDAMSLGQKQRAVLLVVKALLDPDVEPPRVVAAIAATVSAVYRAMGDLVEMEIRNGVRTETRQQLLDAMAEAGYWQTVNEGLEPGEKPD